MKALLQQVLAISIEAGKEILAVYDHGFAVEVKEDGSPLTVADRRSHELIMTRLQNMDNGLPVLSEESPKGMFEKRSDWKRFWLVDPLDGTREFVKRNGEFTVNIALIENGQAILGVVHTPVQGVSHYAAQGVGAFKCTPDNAVKKIQVKKVDPACVTMVESRSHAGSHVINYRQNLAAMADKVDSVSLGSSLKICLVAEGRADIYPRLGPTSEWDTAAAHCVLTVAGGQITDLSGRVLSYNKPDILNPWFLAGGDPAVDWTEFAKQV